MTKSRFTYASYIRTTPEALWDALVNPEKTRMYWFGGRLQSNWTVGSNWQFLSPDGRVINSGQVIENTAPTRLALSWRNELKPPLRAEGFSRLALDNERQGDLVKLTLSQEIDRPASALIDDVADGWPINSFEPEELARDRGALRGNTSLAEGPLKERLAGRPVYAARHRFRRLSTVVPMRAAPRTKALAASVSS
jgi:uncharacterized protein YndB with AHSA1/START domain